MVAFFFTVIIIILIFLVVRRTDSEDSSNNTFLAGFIKKLEEQGYSVGDPSKYKGSVTLRVYKDGKQCAEIKTVKKREDAYSRKRSAEHFYTGDPIQQAVIPEYKPKALELLEKIESIADSNIREEYIEKFNYLYHNRHFIWWDKDSTIFVRIDGTPTEEFDLLKEFDWVATVFVKELGGVGYTAKM